MKARPARTRSRSVYLLQHVAREGTDDEDVKTLGIFSSQIEATRAVRRFKRLAGFARYPNGFHVDRYTLNHSEWMEGFVTTFAGPKKATKHRKRGG